MRAILYRECGAADDVLKVVDLRRPEPGVGDVLVRMTASGVNPHDVKKRSGWLGGAPPADGIVPHSDGAGFVEAAGPGVDPEFEGRRVFLCGAGPMRGTAAEYCVVPASHVFDLPDGLSDAEGASLGVPAFTAWLCTLADGSVAGDTILVHGGSGSVGRVVVEMAAWNGATVIATAGSAARALIPKAKGASHVLNYRADDVAEAVLDLTGGRGVDRIVDIDLAANMATNIRAIADHGLICSYSSTSNREPVLPYYGFALKGVSLTFIQASKMRPADRARAGRTIMALLHLEKIKPDVASIVSFGDCAAAHALVESGDAGANVVIRTD